MTNKQLSIALNPSNTWLRDEHDELLGRANDPKAAVSLITCPEEPQARPKKTFIPMSKGPQKGRKLPPAF